MSFRGNSAAKPCKTARKSAIITLSFQITEMREYHAAQRSQFQLAFVEFPVFVIKFALVLFKLPVLKLLSVFRFAFIQFPVVIFRILGQPLLLFPGSEFTLQNQQKQQAGFSVWSLFSEETAPPGSADPASKTPESQSADRLYDLRIKAVLSLRPQA